jgi:hypothetical protein
VTVGGVRVPQNHRTDAPDQAVESLRDCRHHERMGSRGELRLELEDAIIADFPASSARQHSNLNNLPDGPAAATAREIIAVAIGAAILLLAEALRSNPRILFGRYFWLDELWTKFIESKSPLWNSLVALKYSGDPTPPTYHLIARSFWGLMGGSPEVAFRTLAFLGMWLALILTYALLRRSFAILPAIAAVLALWTSPVIVRYAFFARPYGLLLAATAGFCLVYCTDKKSLSAVAMTSLLAIAVCTLHYFGIFALASIVVGDALVRREAIRERIYRVLPVVAGPIALLFCLPLVREVNRGQTVFTPSPPLTFGAAAQSIVLLLGNSIVAAVVLLIAWGGSALMRRVRKRSSATAKPIPVGSMRPLAGLIALILVPFILAIFSALTHPVLSGRYMITGLLGMVPVLALLASRSARPMLFAATLVVCVVSVWQVGEFAAGQAKWQSDQQQMAEVGRNDNLPIVTFSFHEGYVLYAYAPALRPRLFVADLRNSEGAHLSKMMFHIQELMPKWLSIYPDLPKTATLEDLRAMGKFHLINSEAAVLIEQDAQPSREFSLDEIAEEVGMEEVGAVYRVRPK